MDAEDLIIARRDILPGYTPQVGDTVPLDGRAFHVVHIDRGSGYYLLVNDVDAWIASSLGTAADAANEWGVA